MKTPLCNLLNMQENLEALALYAGQSVGLMNESHIASFAIIIDDAILEWQPPAFPILGFTASNRMDN